MQIKYVVLIGLVGLLTSCGGSKKVGHKSSADSPPVFGRNVPSIESLPNPLEEKTPHFKSDVYKYIYQYKAVAMEEMATYGIPASITLAQGILESKAGRSNLTRRSNNHFGIKCHKHWKGPRVYHDDDKRHECFRKYKNPNYSFRDHSLFLTTRKRYSNLFELAPNDYKGWARGLKADGYATDPAYPRKLIGIIQRYGLAKYDRQVLKSLKSGNWAEVPTVEKGRTASSGSQKATASSQKEKTKATYIVKKGDTLYSISKRFGLSVQELKAINNLTSNVISIGQKLEVSNL